MAFMMIFTIMMLCLNPQEALAEFNSALTSGTSIGDAKYLAINANGKVPKDCLLNAAVFRKRMRLVSHSSDPDSSWALT